MTPIIQYLEKRVQPENKIEARTLRTQAARFTLIDDVLYKRGYSVPLLRCLSETDADYVFREVHEDNWKQFDNRRFRSFCEGFHIKNHFSTPCHPQSNGQVEVVNKILKYTLKARLEESKGNWPEELPGVLWSYRTTHRAAIGETPFSLAYGTEAIIPVEIGAPTFRVANFSEENNEIALRAELDMLEEKRCNAEMRNAVYKQRSERYYNSKVKEIPGR
ncbi:hypothetical protein DH2020_021087 [Rehmannia glutinosa]|uniref:Integrase catalytic domain-containing protein n=1 Tax=Rehmannia glutinosa TaxID=99300 RepID=A0ABR0WD91_REHGL